MKKILLILGLIFGSVFVYPQISKASVPTGYGVNGIQRITEQNYRKTNWCINFDAGGGIGYTYSSSTDSNGYNYLNISAHGGITPSLISDQLSSCDTQNAFYHNFDIDIPSRILNYKFWTITNNVTHANPNYVRWETATTSYLYEVIPSSETFTIGSETYKITNFSGGIQATGNNYDTAYWEEIQSLNTTLNSSVKIYALIYTDADLSVINSASDLEIYLNNLQNSISHSNDYIRLTYPFASSTVGNFQAFVGDFIWTGTSTQNLQNLNGNGFDVCVFYGSLATTLDNFDCEPVSPLTIAYDENNNPINAYDTNSYQFNITRLNDIGSSPNYAEAKLLYSDTCEGEDFLHLTCNVYELLTSDIISFNWSATGTTYSPVDFTFFSTTSPNYSPLDACLINSNFIGDASCQLFYWLLTPHEAFLNRFSTTINNLTSYFPFNLFFDFNRTMQKSLQFSRTSTTTDLSIQLFPNELSTDRTVLLKANAIYDLFGTTTGDIWFNFQRATIWLGTGFYMLSFIL